MTNLDKQKRSNNQINLNTSKKMKEKSHFQMFLLLKTGEITTRQKALCTT